MNVFSFLLLSSFGQLSYSTYTSYDNGYYIAVYTGGSSITWYDAESYCQNTYGTELASLHSANDTRNAEAALSGVGLTSSNNVWIGFNDITTEGTFVWSDGSPVDYTNWHSGEPNDCCHSSTPDGEDCTHMWGGSTWNDMACDPSLLGWTIPAFLCNINSHDACINDNNFYDLTGDGNVVACHGTFSGGMDDSSVDAICNDGWHVCDSAQEAYDLGLTLSQCQSVGTNEIFFARETSNGNARCDSVYNTGGSNDIWGCSGGLTSDWDNVCLNLYDDSDRWNYPACLSMSHFCWSDSTWGNQVRDDSNNLVLSTGPFNSGNEYDYLELLDSNGGVLCCKDEEFCDNDSQDAMCWANGDVHIRMFDGTYYHYMGEGYFDYVAPCDDDEYMPFLISGRQDQCPPWDPYTCLFEVVVTVEDGTQISFPKDGSDR